MTLSAVRPLPALAPPFVSCCGGRGSGQAFQAACPSPTVPCRPPKPVKSHRTCDCPCFVARCGCHSHRSQASGPSCLSYGPETRSFVRSGIGSEHEMRLYIIVINELPLFNSCLWLPVCSPPSSWGSWPRLGQVSLGRTRRGGGYVGGRARSLEGFILGRLSRATLLGRRAAAAVYRPAVRARSFLP